MEWFSLIYPILYLGILVGSLATFSHLYRQRQLNSKLRLAPYFPPHTARNVYLSLLHLPDTTPTANQPTKVPDSILRAALLARAVEDIHRIMEIRTRKPALATLLQRGVVGDEIFQRLVRAEQELEVELKDVVAEANALAPGWGQTIFQSAGEMAQNRLLREKIDGVKTTVAAEKEAWEAQRERARRELEGEGEATGENKKKGTAQQAEISRPTTATSTATSASVSSGVGGAGSVEKVLKATSSDEDAVLVETPGIETTPGQGGVGKNKKKKHKK